MKLIKETLTVADQELEVEYLRHDLRDIELVSVNHLHEPESVLKKDFINDILYAAGEREIQKSRERKEYTGEMMSDESREN